MSPGKRLREIKDLLFSIVSTVPLIYCFLNYLVQIGTHLHKWIQTSVPIQPIVGSKITSDGLMKSSFNRSLFTIVSSSCIL